MDVRDMLLYQHSLVHSDKVALVDARPIHASAWSRASTEQMRAQDEGHSSLAWLLWHMARAEDSGINTCARGVPEVLDRDEWLPRLGVGSRQIGTGWTAEQAAALSRDINLEALQSYRDAVGHETRSWLESVNVESLQADAEGGPRLLASGDHPEGVAAVLAGIFAGKSVMWTVVRLAVWHNFLHLGDAGHVMAIRGIQIYGRE